MRARISIVLAILLAAASAASLLFAKDGSQVLLLMLPLYLIVLSIEWYLVSIADRILKRATRFA
jgi:hypothetical protein